MIIIVPLDPFKNATNLSIEALISQMDILYTLGNCQQRASFIERLKEQAKYLLTVIENSEEELIKEIEGFSNTIINETASTRNNLVKVSKKTNNPELQEMAKYVSSAHDITVKFMGKEENEAIKKILETTTALKEKTHKVITHIEKIRVR